MASRAADARYGTMSCLLLAQIYFRLQITSLLLLGWIVSRFEIIDAYVDPDDYKWIIREQKEECVGESQ